VVVEQVNEIRTAARVKKALAAFALEVELLDQRLQMPHIQTVLGFLENDQRETAPLLVDVVHERDQAAEGEVAQSAVGNALSAEAVAALVLEEKEDELRVRRVEVEQVDLGLDQLERFDDAPFEGGCSLWDGEKELAEVSRRRASSRKLADHLGGAKGRAARGLK